MRYPEFITNKSKIGVCAPSFGTIIQPYKARLNNAIKTFQNLGHEVVLTDHVRKNNKGRSCDAKTRAEEFMSLYFNDDIDMVFSEAGGEFMVEILPYVDFEKIKTAKPKFFQGYSDNTTLTFTLTTICDVASVYSYCFPEFGTNSWHKTLKDNYDFLQGKNNTVESLDKYEIKSLKYDKGKELETFNCTEKVKWKILSKHNKISMKGRLLGGCLDILTVICGTEFDNVKNFIEKYKDDGIIWYLESCDLNVLEQTRAFWQLKNAGWFKYCKGFIIGRPKNTEKIFNINYCEAIYEHLKDLKVPVVADVDLGHVGPFVHFVNGALANVQVKGKKGKIDYILK